MPLVNRTLAEFLGTFLLVFGGCGSAVLAAAFPGVGIGLLGVSLAFGLTVLTMAYAGGVFYGCPLNPRRYCRTLRGAAYSSGRHRSLYRRASHRSRCCRCGA